MLGQQELIRSGIRVKLKRKSFFAAAIPIITLLFSPSLLDAGLITNRSFETGDFTGWNTLGITSVVDSGYGVSPTDGSFQALMKATSAAPTASAIETFLGLSSGRLTEISNANGGTDAIGGSAISQQITATAGEKLTFDWNFLTDEFAEEPVFRDFAFFSLTSQNNGAFIADTFHPDLASSSSEFSLETGYNSTTITFNSSGTYMLGFGVVAVEDNLVDSGLLIDNVEFSSAAVPEANAFTALLALLCVAGLVAAYRRWGHHISGYLPFGFNKVDDSELATSNPSAS